MRRVRSLAVLFLVATAHVSLGCGTEAVGVEACRKIENARCASFKQCGLLTDLDACQRYYRDQCLGGVPGKVTPNATQVNSCVAAIAADATCGVAKAPEESKECAFLAVPVDNPGAGGAGAGGAGTGGSSTGGAGTGGAGGK
ncbi:MAG: hypothetical protein SFV15_15115 [Polyangiaceae bacterium]|nr:hypothetical protein [Polyangiaceae bacterium]